MKTEAEIGKGHFGKVYKGSYQGKETAVKILCNRSAENAVIELGGQLASLSHPNIVKYYGYVQDEIIWVVMDFCVYGSLKGLVLKDGSGFLTIGIFLILCNFKTKPHQVCKESLARVNLLERKKTWIEN